MLALDEHHAIFARNSQQNSYNKFHYFKYLRRLLIPLLQISVRYLSNPEDPEIGPYRRGQTKLNGPWLCCLATHN